MMLPTRIAVLAAALVLSGCAVVELEPDPAEDAFDDGVPELPEPAEGHSVPLEVAEVALDGAMLFVPVTIDGEGPFSFVLDTGATNSTIDASLAEELDLQETGGEGEVTGVTGQAVGTLVAVESWQLGEVDLDAREIVAVDLGGDGDGGVDVDGLLGGDVLSGFGTLTLDYDEGVLLLDE